jgi:diacylglycerol kinase (ATP)
MPSTTRGKRPPPSSFNTSISESPHKGRRGLDRIIRAFAHSLAGLGYAWRLESAFRQEIGLALLLAPVVFLLPFTALERALLLFSMIFVLVVELINSSIEAAIDRISLSDHQLSKRAKDLGSAAVLIALLLSALLWLMMLPAALARLGH